MIKVCFVSWHFKDTATFLKNIIKMTPQKSGKWKDMVAVTNPDEADFCAVFDGTNIKVPFDRTLFFGEHPDCLQSYREWEDIECLGKFPLKQYLNPGEWWLEYDYDYLMNLKPPQKHKNLLCVFTAHTHTAMYVKRKNFVANFCEQYSDIDLFGRPSANFTNDVVLKKYYKGVLGKTNPENVTGDHQLGKEILVDYKYSLEFDVGPTQNYISERFYDAMLLWCMPFYFGSNNVDKYLPKKSFRYIDMEKGADQITKAIKNNYYEQNIDEIAKARDLLLNKYQIWPYVHDVIGRYI